MHVKIKVDHEKSEIFTLPDEHLVDDWLVIVSELARPKAFEKAREENGRSFWQREIVHSIRENSLGTEKGEVFSDSYIADHVHTGGTIKPKNAKFLAIPIHKKAKGKNAREYPWAGGEPVFVVANNQCFLAEKLKTKTNLLYVLKKSVYQKPRPWWPTLSDVEQESRKLFAY